MTLAPTLFSVSSVASDSSLEDWALLPELQGQSAASSSGRVASCGGRKTVSVPQFRRTVSILYPHLAAPAFASGKGTTPHVKMGPAMVLSCSSVGCVGPPSSLIWVNRVSLEGEGVSWGPAVFS